MRQIEGVEQLEQVLNKSYEVIKRRDNLYYMFEMKLRNDEAIENLKKLRKKRTDGGMAILLLILTPIVTLFPANFTEYAVDDIIPIPHLGFWIWLIYSVLLTALIMVIIALAINGKIKKIKANEPALLHNIEVAKSQLLEAQEIFWCMEVVPSEYRSQKAMEIMLNAIASSRADDWKECCNIYDAACQRDEMRQYQAEQLAMTQRAANNAEWAADAAWAMFLWR
jgi:hypothetical protein